MAVVQFLQHPTLLIAFIALLHLQGVIFQAVRYFLLLQTLLLIQVVTIHALLALRRALLVHLAIAVLARQTHSVEQVVVKEVLALRANEKGLIVAVLGVRQTVLNFRQTQRSGA